MRAAWLLLTVAIFSVFVRADSSAPAAWQPIAFPFPSDAAERAIDDLAAKNDPVLASVIAANPQFRQAFGAAFSSFAEIALRSLPAPWDSEVADDASRSSLTWLSYAFGKTAKNLQIFIAENSVRQAAPGYSEPENGIDYAYCDAHSADSEFCHGSSHEHNGVNWAIARRIFSSAAFVRAACPSIRPFAAWNLNWSGSSEKGRKDIEAFFAETDRLLRAVYGNGDWKPTSLDGFKTPLESGIPAFVLRRYLDGGPELISAARDCLATIQTDFESQGGMADAAASDSIAAIANFAVVALPSSGKNLSLQTAPLNADALYRLSHHLQADAPLPLPRYLRSSGSSTYAANEYLNTVIDMGKDGFGPDAHSLVRLIAHLNAVDPAFHYRSLNRSEFTELFKLGNARGIACLVEGDEDAGTIAPYQIEPSTGAIANGDCQLLDARLVREARSGGTSR